MKIGVNAGFLKKPYTGIGQYTHFLYKELLKSGDEYVLMTPEKTGFKSTYVLNEISAGPDSVKKTYWEQIQVPQFLKKEKVDVAHFPYPCNPWYPYKIPTVVTIHDTIPWDFPEYTPKVLSKLYHYQSKRAAKKATKIITVSEASKKDIIRHLKVPASKVKVIHNAASPVFSHDIKEDKLKEILDKHNLKKPYLLYVGGYDKRKNVNMLLEIYNKYIAPKYGVDLALAGEKLYNSPLYDDPDNLTQNPNNSSLKARGHVKRLGFVSNEELAAIYRGSLCLLHLSKKEGFNIPIVEAAESGAPLILSDTEVHREIAGNGADYVDLENEKEIAGKIERVVKDDHYRRELLEKSSHLKGKYTWEKAAEETLAVFKSLK
ncbi:MAG: glycosyltransferase family 1 protein [Nitrospirota bacterium]